MGWNLLILSDLHLGEQAPAEDRDVVQQRADTQARHFGEFLAHYSHHREQNLPWRLVIAGDMIDFMRIHVPHEPSDLSMHAKSTKPLLQDGTLWLYPPHDLKGTLAKLEQIFVLHHQTFSHLISFMLAGHEVYIITGNHDAELDWPEVQEAFRDHLHALAQQDYPQLDISLLHEFQERLCFCPRFYYEPERVYIEHGHFYDGYCNITESYTPSPLQDTNDSSDELPQRHLGSFTHTLNGFQYQNPDAFATLPMHHIDQWSALDILRWFFLRPLRQQYLLCRTFARMTLRLIWMAWSFSFRRILNLPDEHRQQATQQWADEHNLPIEAVEPLQKFVTPPLHTSIFDTIQALYMDRIFLIAITPLLMTVIFVSPWSPELKSALATAVTVAFVAAFQYLSHRRPISETIPMLFSAAIKISTYLETPLVIMAHSHNFEQRELRDGQLYINLGAWTVPETFLSSAFQAYHTYNTPSSDIPAVPAFETPYLIINTSKPPHHFTIGSWSSHRPTPSVQSLASLSAVSPYQTQETPIPAEYVAEEIS